MSVYLLENLESVDFTCWEPNEVVCHHSQAAIVFRWFMSLQTNRHCFQIVSINAGAVTSCSSSNQQKRAWNNSVQLYSINTTPVSTADVLEQFFHDVNESSLDMLNRFIPSKQNLQVCALKKKKKKLYKELLLHWTGASFI